MTSLFHNLLKMRWRAISSLGLIYLSIFTYEWLWAVLLIFWGLTDLVKGETWLSETISRSENAVLFFVLNLSYLGFGFYLVSKPLFQLFG